MKKENTVPEKAQPGGKKQGKTNHPEPKNHPEKGLTKEDLPDATNQSTGVPGSGQRQDSN